MSNKLVRGMLAVTLSSFGIALSAHADSLYFEKAEVKTASEATCLRFAADAARNLAFQNGHHSVAEVAGVKNGVYVSITCIGRGQQNALAVVMAVAPNFTVAQQVGHLVAGKVKGVTLID